MIMTYLKMFEDFTNETIKASEAYNIMNAIQTVLDGKRELAYVTVMDNKIYWPNNMDEYEALVYALESGLKTIKVKKTGGKAWIVYNKDKKAAQKLAKYAESKGGFLSDNTPDEARFVGNMLGYHQDDIDSFVNRVYKNTKE